MTDREPAGRGDDAEERREALPAHEYDDPDVAGGGVLGEGGTAVVRGTGSLGGTAQGPDADADPADLGPDKSRLEPGRDIDADTDDIGGYGRLPPARR